MALSPSAAVFGQFNILHSEKNTEEEIRRPEATGFIHSITGNYSGSVYIILKNIIEKKSFKPNTRFKSAGFCRVLLNP